MTTGVNKNRDAMGCGRAVNDLSAVHDLLAGL